MRSRTANEDQLTLFDFANNIKPGDYVKRHGANICHIMRPGYIGKMVVYECSTASREWFRAGILEAYIPYEDTYRSIIDIGTKQRILLTHRPGVEIYEVEPWEWKGKLIRCRDCGHWEAAGKAEYGICHSPAGSPHKTGRDGFCRNAERKGEDNNGTQT